MTTDAKLHPDVQVEAGGIVSALHTAGWMITATHYDQKDFGNWYIDLVRNGDTIRLIKDRSQYMIDGSQEEIKSAGLFKAFDEIRAFHDAVVAWATQTRA